MSPSKRAQTSTSPNAGSPRQQSNMEQQHWAGNELTESTPLLPQTSNAGWSTDSKAKSALLLLLVFLFPLLLSLHRTTDAPAILTHSQGVTPSRSINDTFHLLSLNTFIRPFLIGVHDYKDERLKDMLPIFLTRDLLCLQELFWTTGNRKTAFLENLAEKYPYSAHAPKPTLWDWFHLPPKPIDAGLAILSARPIVSTDFHMYTASEMFSVDYLVQKGVLYAGVEVSGMIVHVFTTHMQAGPYPDIHERQLRELVKFVGKKVPKGEGVILAGDFNINGRRGYDDLRDSDEYVRMIGILGKIGLYDAMRPLGQVVTTAGGLWGGWQRNERIDYLFVGPGETKMNVRDVGVDKLGVHGKDYLTMSDHYAVVADIDVVNE